MSFDPDPIDWSLCTPEGQQREQLRRWMNLPLLEKLYAVEQMGEYAQSAKRALEEPNPKRSECSPGSS